TGVQTYALPIFSEIVKVHPYRCRQCPCVLRSEKQRRFLNAISLYSINTADKSSVYCIQILYGGVFTKMVDDRIKWPREHSNLWLITHKTRNNWMCARM